MLNTKNTIGKTATAKNAKNAKNAKAKVEKIGTLNLSKYAEKLAKVEIKEKVKKSHLYLYPENFTEAQINSVEGKKFRNKQRNILQRFVNNILLFAKMNRIEDLKKEIENFDSFYKATYRLNDYTIHSITNKAEEKQADIKIAFEIISDVKGK